MTNFQIFMLVLAALVIGSSFIDTKTILDKLKNLLRDTPKKNENIIPIPPTPPVPDTSVKIDVTPYIPPKKELRISDIVLKWEELRGICLQNKLYASTTKLDDMFGTFLDLVKEEVKNDD